MLKLYYATGTCALATYMTLEEAGADYTAERLSFKDNHVVIPIEVIEEIDTFKRESSELGQNARTVSRMLGRR